MIDAVPGSIARVLTLLELLQGGGTQTLASLADRLGVDSRTVRRYIAHLLDLDVPVESVRGRYGGYRIAAGFRLPPLMLTDDEALAVLLGLAHGGTVRGGEAGPSATAKILRVLPATSRARFEALLQHADLSGAGPADAGSIGRPETAVLLIVAEAAGQRRPIRLDYVDRDGRGSHRIVLPYGLVARTGRWYLSAADSLSGEVRTFRVDRMRDVEPQESTFEIPPGFDLARSVADGLAATPWRYAVSVLVEASADHVAERLPDGLATITEVPPGDAAPPGPSLEGWVRVELRAQRLGWIPALLAGLDRPFIVEEPPELTEAVAALGRRLLDIAGSS
jgi:predicted DNA-binding transcriptional regulator YafY